MTLKEIRWEAEKRALIETLEKTRSVTEAGKILGIGRTNFHRTWRRHFVITPREHLRLKRVAAI